VRDLGDIYESLLEQRLVLDNAGPNPTLQLRNQKGDRKAYIPKHLDEWYRDVLPVEILGAIYERLGKVVRTTEQRVKIDDKPEVRKAGGVYYTPEYIVRYIIESTVGKLLAECQVPARRVLQTPLRGSLKKREIGSTSSSRVSLKRRREMSVCTVRMLAVRMPGFQFRT